MMKDNQHFQRWDKWLGVIGRDVRNLVIGHHVQEEVRKIVLANPRLHKPSSFYDLSTMTFAAWAAMTVRRQMDPKSISIVKLLSAIQKRPEVVSRKRFVNTFAAKMMAGFAGHDTEPSANEGLNTRGAYAPSRAEVEGFANQSFDGLVGSGAYHLDSDRVSRELKELHSRAVNLEKFATTMIAHLVGEPTEPPAMPELDACVGAMEKLVLRYVMLFRASVPTSLLPTWQYDWKAIFRVPWL